MCLSKNTLNCQRSRDHAMASHGSSQKESVSKGPAHVQKISLSHRHWIISQNRDFSQRLIRLSYFHSLSGILGSPLLSLSSSRFISLFDMVAEQSHHSGTRSFATSSPVLSSHDDSTTTRPTNQITSSSGEKERNH